MPRSMSRSVRRRCSMSWAIVMILSPCSAAYGTRSGTRAIVPSSLLISQITPAGMSPARRARSTAASVWPARSSTPPGRARRGNTWPGLTMSSGPASGSIATMIVRERSGAEMPVVMPWRASIGSVNAVACGASLRFTTGFRPSWSQRAARERQADQPAPVGRHEVDGLGRGELRRHDEVALVLAVLGVEDHDHPAGADLLDRLGDGGEVRGLAGRHASSRGGA